jgi:hypothetical protein
VGWERWGGSGLGWLLCLGGSDAGVVELQDVGVMHEAVDRSHGGEGVLEDLVPFGEDQIAADQ